MSHFREKTAAQTKQIIGQMLGDELLERAQHVSRVDRGGDPPGKQV